MVLFLAQDVLTFVGIRVSAFAGSGTTIYYQSGLSGTPYVHYGINGKWTTLPGQSMQTTSQSGWFQYVIADAPDSGTLEITFNDGNNHWDSMGGKNYKVDLPAQAVTIAESQLKIGAPDGISTTVNIKPIDQPDIQTTDVPDVTKEEPTITPTPKVVKKPAPIVTATPVPLKKPFPFPSVRPTTKLQQTKKPIVTATPVVIKKVTIIKPNSKFTSKPYFKATPKPIVKPTKKPISTASVAFVPVDQTNMKVIRVKKPSLEDILNGLVTKPIATPVRPTATPDPVYVTEEPSVTETPITTSTPTVKPTPTSKPIVVTATPEPTATNTPVVTFKPTPKTPVGVVKASEPLGGDMRDESIYFVMTARFDDGDSSNNRGGQFDEKAGNKANNDPMFRGDFKGLIDKLDYIKAMGFSAIWITPVVLNRSDYDYHGYHGYDFYRVDARLESPGATYQDLINDAHKKGIKIIQDIVLNHTSKWGLVGLYQFKAFGIRDKDWSWYYDQTNPDFVYDGLSVEPNSGKSYYNGDLWSTDEPSGNTCKNWGKPTKYRSKEGGIIYECQWPNPTTGMFPVELFHQCWIGNWEGEDARSCWIHEDLADLNTENETVQKYLLGAYEKYIDMGVDGFRVDTAVHIPRTTFNKVFLPELLNYAEKKWGEKGKDFYIVGEVAAFVNDKWNRGSSNQSPQFYTWKERKEYSSDLAKAALEMYQWENNQGTGSQPTSDNAFLKGNAYHKPDYSKFSGMNIIDMRMHMNFSDAGNAYYNGKDSDDVTNDATYNMVYVDSHDFGPNKSSFRYSGGTDAWAENMSLMWTFRGIPTLYYGSEIEFQAGKQIDCGPTCPLATTGRAYYGDEIKGNIKAADFGVTASADGKVAETMNKPLIKHLQRLNQIRRAIPALQKGQYSTEGVQGGIAYKRRFTEGSVDSFVLVTVSGDATFSGIPNGTYVDAVTGDKQNVSGGTLSAKCSGKGNMRAYVLELPGNPAPGKIGAAGPFLK